MKHAFRVEGIPIKSLFYQAEKGVSAASDYGPQTCPAGYSPLPTSNTASFGHISVGSMLQDALPQQESILVVCTTLGKALPQCETRPAFEAGLGLLGHRDVPAEKV